MPGLLDGKAVIVTGSARGQGAAEARCFVEEGARVLVSDVRDAEGEAVAAALGPAAVYQHLDVRDESQWSAAVSAVREKWGRIDGLVNNAGLIALHGRMVEIDRDQFELGFAVHMLGPFLGMRAVAPSMAENGGGAIVNITSTAAHLGAYGVFSYSATKWGLRGMTLTAAMELAPMNIRVNNVAPSNIDVGATMSQEDTEGFTGKLAAMGYDLTTFGAWNMMNRSGRPEEIARFIAFLLSDNMSYVTAQDFLFDPGSTKILSAPPREKWATQIGPTDPPGEAA